MALIDVIIIILIGGFGMFGLWFGLLHTFGSLFGTFIGVFIATRFFEIAGNILISITGWQENLAYVIMFTLIFIIVNRLVGFVFWIFEKTFGIVAKMPFLNSLNHMLGGILGVFEGVITVGMILYFIEKYPYSQGILDAIAGSELAAFCIGSTIVLAPFISDTLKAVAAASEFIEDVF